MNKSQLSNKKNQKKNLTKNQEIVLKLLENSNEPLKAYSILFNLSEYGVKAPLQVYRALDKLIELGKVHKIESKNAFIACINSNCKINSNNTFTICEQCDEVLEIHDNILFKNLNNLADQEKFKLNKFNLELYITCKNCLK